MEVDSRASQTQDFLSIFGGLFFLGIFLGLVFLLATVLIIYYKQITEGYEVNPGFSPCGRWAAAARDPPHPSTARC